MTQHLFSVAAPHALKNETHLHDSCTKHNLWGATATSVDRRLARFDQKSKPIAARTRRDPPALQASVLRSVGGGRRFML